MSIWIKKHKRLLVTLLFPYLFLLFLLAAPSPYGLTSPGGITPVSQAIQIDDRNLPSQFYTVYVYSYHPITPFQRMLTEVSNRIELYRLTERQKDTSIQDQFRMGQMTKDISLQTSIIKAYELASQTDNRIEIKYIYEGLQIYYRPSRIKELEVGDIIYEINGFRAVDFEHLDFYGLFYESQTHELKIKRGNSNEFTYNYQRLADESWMTFYPKYQITHSNPNYVFSDTNIGGPSGGMIQALSIYVSLVNLNFGDLKIAGTGTIEIDGSIGRIGGIRQKLYTAEDQKVDLFIMPKRHEVEIPNEDFSFTIILVETLEEAVNYLYERFK